MVPGSDGSKASARPSVTAVIRLIHRICTGGDRQGKPGKKRDDDDRTPRPQLVGSVQLITFLMLSIDGSPLAHGGGDGGEVVVGQHQGRRLLCGLACL